ncbi:MAG: metallophosphoesterase [Bacteroidia bacterium]
MRFFLFGLQLLLIPLLDFYTYQAVKTAFPDKPWVKIAFWAIHIAIYISLFALIFMMPQGAVKTKYAFLYVAFIVLMYIPKLFIAPILLFEDISRLIRWIYQYINTSEILDEDGVVKKISRAKFLSQMALGVSIIPFGTILYGVLRTKYNYQVQKIKVAIKDLPQEFIGFTITQISDLHTGSYENKAAVAKGMELVNAQNSDMIVFTGDLINWSIKEIEGFQEVYSKLKAKEGVFSILGNHDYYGGKADRLEREVNGEKETYRKFKKDDPHLKQVMESHATFGWKLLVDEHIRIEKNGKKLALMGVGNCGRLPHFPNEGDLTKAYQGTEDSDVKILLSHDPTHWEAEVLKNFPDIDLTLSGHTHGAQFGIEIPGLRWSPVQYIYKQWAGLYQQGKQYLYVNRGFGFLGFSGRIGIRPEITVLELVQA